MATLEIDPLFSRCEEELQQAQTLKEFLIGAADILLNCSVWRLKEPVAYSPTAGKPVRYEWRRHGQWRGILYTHIGFSGDVRVPDNIRTELVQ